MMKVISLFAATCMVGVAFGFLSIRLPIRRPIPLPRIGRVGPVADRPKIRPVLTAWSRCSRTCGRTGTMYRMFNGKRVTSPCGRILCKVVDPKCKLDLTLVLDRSGSTHSHWGEIKQFAKDIVSSVPVGSTKVRVGLITYASTAVMNFDLNDRFTKALVHAGINRVANTWGSTNTASALQMLNNIMYTPARGDRWGVRNVAIVLTDGKSNSMAQTAAKANIAKGEPKNILMYAVGVGSANVAELNAISSGPGFVHHVGGIVKLQGIITHLSKNACEHTEKYDCCSVCGDPHYHTFDKKWIHFQGKCKYNVASRLGVFYVFGKNKSPTSSSTVSYLEYFDIRYGSSRVRLGPGNTATIQPSGTTITPGQTVGGIHVSFSGGKLIATLTNNVEVTYKGNHCGKVCVPDKYAKYMKGICGNYDSNAFNDLRTSFDMPVPDTFLGHFILGSSHQVFDFSDRYCCTKIKRAPCERDHTICKQIKEKYKTCEKKVDLGAAYKACKQDVCAAGRVITKQRAAACNVIDQIVDACRQKGVPVTDICSLFIRGVRGTVARPPIPQK